MILVDGKIGNLRNWTKDDVWARQGKANYTYEVAGVGVYRVDPVFTRAHEWAKPVFEGFRCSLNTALPRDGKHWISCGPNVQTVREGIAACAAHFNSDGERAIERGSL